jgi:mannitol/fructose-specific phosphotransferase system IIA component (Ntr-type)
VHTKFANLFIIKIIELYLGGCYMLSDILKKEYIKLNVECTNWEEAIRAAGNVLIDNGLVTNEYVEETINGVKELGPYSVITKGVAMPHFKKSSRIWK